MLSTNYTNSLFRLAARNFSKIRLQTPSLEFKQVDLAKFSTFEELSKSLHPKVEIRSWDNSVIAPSNSLAHYKDDLVYVKIGDLDWQRLDLNEEEENLDPTKIDSDDLIKAELSSINGNLARFDLPEDTRSALSNQIFGLKCKLPNILNGKEELRYKKLQSIFGDYYSLKEELASLSAQETKLHRSANLRAQLVIVLGGLIFVAQLCWIFHYTFHVWAWDVTEPITYLISIFNIILAIVLKKRFGRMDAFEFYAKRYFNKLCKANNYNPVNKTALEKRIAEIEKNIIN